MPGKGHFPPFKDADAFAQCSILACALSLLLRHGRGGGGRALGRSAGMSPIPPAALTAAHLGLVQTLLYAVLGLKSHRGSGLDGHPVIMGPLKTICDFFGHREAGVVGGELKVGAGNHLQGSPHCISMPPLSCAKLDFISYHSEV